MKKRKTKHSTPPAAPAPKHPAKAMASGLAPAVAPLTPSGGTEQAAAPSWAGEAEPTMRPGGPLPVVLIVITAALLYLGDLYLMNTAGQFDARVYYPYRSAKQLDELQPKSDTDETYSVGRRVYNSICVQCHQPNGQGNPTAFIPPLVASEWVLAEEPGRLIRLVYNGLQGPLKVKGESYGQAAMFAVGDQLPGDDEAKARQVAGVLTYIRRTWGNQAPPVTLERVKAAHAKFKGRTDPWTADELLAIPETE